MLGGGGPVGGPRRNAGGPLTVADLLEGAQRAAAATAATGAAATAAAAATPTPSQSPLGASPTAAATAAAAAADAAADAHSLGSSLAIPALDSICPGGPLGGPLGGPPGGPLGGPPGAPKRGPVRRLMIEKVVLENFKSYSQKKVIGPFHKRFTAIVGPNGSGKSNVIDAMLFVFGRRAQQIRLRNVTELIHNSAAAAAAAEADAAATDPAHPAKPKKKAAAEQQQQQHTIDRASVSVFFQEIIDPDPAGEAFEVVAGSEFVVRREVSRHCSSTSFSVNGKCCSKTQVFNLLRSKGLDLRNKRFLILQGEVEQIALMRPKATRAEETGLLEYLEELIETNKYKEAIAAAEQYFDTTCQLYQEKANRMRCTAAELKRLQGPRDEALLSLKSNRQAAAAKLLLAAIYRRKRRREAEQTREKLQVAEEQQKENEAKVEGLKASLQKVEEEAAGQATKLKQGDKECSKAERELQQLVVRDEELRAEVGGELSRLQEKQQQQQQLEQRQQQQQQLLQQLEAALQQRDADKESKSLKAAEAEVEAAKEAVEQYQESIKDEVQQLSAAHVAAEKELLQQQQQLDRQLTAAAKVTSALELLQRKEKQIRERQQQAQELLRRCGETETANAAALQQQQQQLAAAAADLKTVQQQKRDADKEISSLEQQLLQAKGQISGIEQQRNERRCKDRLQSLLQQQKKEGKLQGLIGRLGQLGIIDKKYERAFLAASGGFSSYYVVEKPSDAHELFELLRVYELGRCNVLALQVLEKELSGRLAEAEAEAARCTDTSAPRLLDLLHFISPRFKIAFFKSVGNTRVAADMEHATHLAYALRQRVVTLEGGLIELDGRMVGGGLGFGGCSIRTDTQRASAAAAAAAPFETEQQQQQELQQLQQTIKQLQGAISEHKRRREELATNEKHLERQRAEAESAIELLQQDIAAAQLQRREAELRSKRASQEELTKAEANKLKQLQAEVSSHSASQAAIHKQVQQQEAKVNELMQQLQQAGGEEMRKRKARLLKAERAFNLLKEKEGKQQQEVAAKRAELQRIIKDKGRLQREIQTHQERTEELQESLAALEEEARKVVEKLEEAKTQRELLLQQQQQLQKQQQQLEETLKETALASLETQHLYDSLKQQLQQQQQQEQQQQRQFSAALECLMEIDATIQAEEEEPSESEQQQQQQQQEPVLALTDGSVDAESEQQEKPQEQQQQQQQQQAYGELGPGAAALLQRLQIDLSESSLRQYSSEAISKLQQEQQQQEQQQQQQGWLHALQLFSQKRQELLAKEKETRAAAAERDAAKTQLESLRAKRKEEFMAAFSIIATKLKETYRMLSQGGDAELELVDPSDPFTEGVLLSVRPPKKSWRHIQNLSGGERTLSSLSLVFALHQFKPTWIYFLDEIDAALDFKNAAVAAAFLLHKAADAQLIVVSLRNQLFELASRLIGIYKTFDATKSVTLDPGKLAAAAAAAAANGEQSRKRRNESNQDQKENLKEIADEQEAQQHASQQLLALPAAAAAAGAAPAAAPLLLP